MGRTQADFAKFRNRETRNISTSRCLYDVFLSFRGKDTRKSFTDHLYTALVESGIRTFRDDDELERGEDITRNLPKGIRESHCSIIVFSKDYASSQWCLNELVMILHYKRTSGHAVLPVFYDVDPSEVRNQSGSFAKPFEELERLVKPMSRIFDKEFGAFWSTEVEGWRAALREVADLAGMNLRNQADGHESKFIKKIVTVIEEKLCRTSLSVTPYLIGIDSQVNSIDTWVQDESSEVGMFVIYGMAGVGKTTLAKYVYNSNFKRFDGSSFLENISEVSRQADGLVRLQRQLISNISRRSEININNVSEGTNKIRDVIGSKRVIVVLDDVDQLDQLNAILGMRDWFHPGSKIIITTRQRLLKAHEVHKLYEVRKLYNYEALKLFSWHAFGQDQPFEDYLYYSYKIADHCGGLPLALQILGSSLSGKPTDVWESAWRKLKDIPNSEILKKLKLSYDTLQDDHDQNLFLDIACFFIGEDKDFIVGILDECDFHTKIGIQNLIDRSMITVDLNNKVVMHRLLRDMGREIIRQESPKEPSKRSRVWNPKDSFNVLTEKMGGDTIEGIVVNMHNEDTPLRNSTEAAIWETNSFAQMHKLRLLILNHVQLNGYYTSFPKRLRWLSWSGFPMDSIPGDLNLQNLIALDMRYSMLKRVWRYSKRLPSLKILDLSHSGSLTKTPDFSFLPKLERVILKDCSSLVDVHESIGNLDRLVYLNMNDCKSIKKLPKNFCKLEFLETLLLTGCSSLNDFPIEDLWMMRSLKVFRADGTPVNQSLNSIQGKNKLSPSFPRYLVSISLVNCNLQSEDAFPLSLANLSGLRDLNLSENPIVHLPDSIRNLPELNRLDFTNCTRLEVLVGLPKVDTLVVSFCSALRIVTFKSADCRSLNLERIDNKSLVEFEYWFKLEPVAEVDPELINLLGVNLRSLHGILIDMHSVTWLGIQRLPIQGLHEHGIFSIFFPALGNEIPGVFSHTSRDSSISFTMPMLPDVRIQGLNVYCVYATDDTDHNELIITDDHHDASPKDMMIQVYNMSTGLKWIYAPLFFGYPDEGKDMIWLSYWKLDNQLGNGNEATVSVFANSRFTLKECGIQIVYEPEKDMSGQDNNNSINSNIPSKHGGICGYWTDFEVSPGTYILMDGPAPPEGYTPRSKMWTWFRPISEIKVHSGVNKEEMEIESEAKANDPSQSVSKNVIKRWCARYLFCLCTCPSTTKKNLHEPQRAPSQKAISRLQKSYEYSYERQRVKKMRWATLGIER